MGILWGLGQILLSQAEEGDKPGQFCALAEGVNSIISVSCFAFFTPNPFLPLHETTSHFFLAAPAPQGISPCYFSKPVQIPI